MRIRTLLTILVCALIAAPAAAQTLTKLGPTDSIRFNWPAAVVAPDSLDAPDGYRIKAVSTTQAGVVIRSWDVAGAATTTWTMTPAQVPAGLFNVTIHPYNVAGEAAGSNAVGPFGKAATPKSLTGVTGSVVAGGSASLARPESGAVAFTSTPSSIPSTTLMSRVVSGPWSAFPMAASASLNRSLRPVNRSDSESPTSSRQLSPNR